ncbi:hypothetical protein L6452_31944 [Arctium lappa]|uniref:Uncharacterized protein n=1 Tax=Arctium lappa TaxID=4217 RepID=A0ACB8Z340_ARCLA|nr:hypothetical protein L6452_31944 [Arctium lappa]
MLALSKFLDEAFDVPILQPSMSPPVSNPAPSPPLPTWSCCDDDFVPSVAPASELAASTDHTHDANPEDPPSAPASPELQMDREKVSRKKDRVESVTDRINEFAMIEMVLLRSARLRVYFLFSSVLLQLCCTL